MEASKVAVENFPFYKSRIIFTPDTWSNVSRRAQVESASLKHELGNLVAFKLSFSYWASENANPRVVHSRKAHRQS